MAVPTSSTIQKGVGSSVTNTGTKGAADAGRVMAENVSASSGNFFRDNALLIAGVLLATLVIVNLDRR